MTPWIIKPVPLNLGQSTAAAGGNGDLTVETVTATPASFDTTSTSYVDITSATLTKPDITDGKCYDSLYGSSDVNSANVGYAVALNDDGSVIQTCGIVGVDAGQEVPTSLFQISDADGNTLKAQLKTASNTARWLVGGDYESLLASYGVG